MLDSSNSRIARGISILHTSLMTLVKQLFTLEQLSQARYTVDLAFRCSSTHRCRRSSLKSMTEKQDFIVQTLLLSSRITWKRKLRKLLQKKLLNNNQCNGIWRRPRESGHCKIASFTMLPPSLSPDMFIFRQSEAFFNLDTFHLTGRWNFILESR